MIIEMAHGFQTEIDDEDYEKLFISRSKNRL